MHIQTQTHSTNERTAHVHVQTEPKTIYIFKTKPTNRPYFIGIFYRNYLCLYFTSERFGCSKWIAQSSNKINSEKLTDSTTLARISEIKSENEFQTWDQNKRLDSKANTDPREC